MIEIMSYGNQLCTGEYKIHSRFSSAVNFISGDTFVFVVNESVGAGPVNIVVNGIVQQSVDSLEIEETYFKLNGAEFGFESDKRYDPFININDFEYDRFVKNLAIVERGVIEKASQQSLSFLLKSEDQEKKMDSRLPDRAGLRRGNDKWGIGNNKSDGDGQLQNIPGSFEEECRTVFRAGANQVLYGNVLTGVKMIKGLGPGLTPSGDDFNSGLLIALNLVNKINAIKPLRFRKTSEVLDQVYHAALGKNLFTNSFLLCASKGQFFFKFRELINAVLSSEYNKIIKNTELVLTMGETSGADQLTGFLIGMKRFLK